MATGHSPSETGAKESWTDKLKEWLEKTCYCSLSRGQQKTDPGDLKKPLLSEPIKPVGDRDNLQESEDGQLEGSHDKHVTKYKDPKDTVESKDKESPRYEFDLVGKSDDSNNLYSYSNENSLPPPPYKDVMQSEEKEDEFQSLDLSQEDELEARETYWPRAEDLIRSSPNRYTEYADDEEEQKKKAKFASIVARLDELDDILSNVAAAASDDESVSSPAPVDRKRTKSLSNVAQLRTTLSTIEFEANDMRGTMQRAVEKKTKYLQEKLTDLYSQGGLFNEIYIDNYHSVKNSNTAVIGDPMYTHPGGYTFRVEIWPNGVGMSEGTHISVDIVSLKGEYDAELKFPACFTVTLQLVNQYRDQDHCTKSIECFYKKDDYNTEIGSEFEFILKSDLYWNEERETQYLINDVLQFCVTNVELNEPCDPE